MPLAPALRSGLDGLAHSATEGNAALELLGDGLGDEVGVELGALDLDNVDGELALGDAGDLLELGAEAVSISAPFLPMTTPGRAVRMMTFTLSPARSISTRETAARERRLLEVLAELEVVTEGLSVVLLCEPAGAPVLGDAKTEAGGVDFLTHDSFTPPFGERRRR